jgi:hypothetical protein
MTQSGHRRPSLIGFQKLASCLTSLRRVTVRRRDFIKVIAGSAAAWPLAARAQQPTTPVIGFLGSTSADASRIAAFRQGLALVGYVEGRNVAVEYRWAEGRSDWLPAMVSDLVHRQVAVIAATGTPAALAAKRRTLRFPLSSPPSAIRCSSTSSAALIGRAAMPQA